MNIAKSSKKIMAFALGFALAATSIVSSPKASKATGSKPTVTPLGATLRMNDDSGKQSMRFGIQIDNADQVKDCSVDIKVGDKTVTVSTDASKSSDNKAANKIYKKDGNSVVYTVVVKGIDKDNFDKQISFTGKATAIDNATSITDTQPQAKTVNGIVTSLGSDYSLIEGDLYKTVYSWDFDDNSNPFFAQNQFPGYNGEGSEAPTVEGGILKMTALKMGYSGIQFKVKSKGEYYLSMKAKSDEANATAVFYYGITGNIGAPVSLTNEWQDVNCVHTITDADIKKENWGNTGDIIRVSGGKDNSQAFEIDDLKVLKKATDVEIKDIVSDNEVVLTTTKELSQTVQTWNLPGDFNDVPNGFNIKDYSKAEIVIKAYKDVGKTQPIESKLSAWAAKLAFNTANPNAYGDGINNNAQNLQNRELNEDGTFTLSYDISQLDNIETITSQADGGFIKALEIISLKLVK